MGAIAAVLGIAKLRKQPWSVRPRALLPERYREIGRGEIQVAIAEIKRDLWLA